MGVGLGIVGIVGIGGIVVYAENETEVDAKDGDAEGIREKLGEKLNVIGDRERFPEELVVIVTVTVTGAVKVYRGLVDIFYIKCYI